MTQIVESLLCSPGMKHNKPLSGFHNLILHVKAEKDNLFSHLTSWVRLCDSDYGFPVQWRGAGKFEARMLCSGISFFFSFSHLNAVNLSFQSVQSLKHSILVKDRQTDSCIFQTVHFHYRSSLNRSDDNN